MDISRFEEAAMLPVGTTVGPWRVVSVRGSGTYGVVHQVERIGREEEGPFALKIGKRPLDPRFDREGELLRRIHHPHVPRLYDRGWRQGPLGMPMPYLVMEWVEGVPLYEWARRHAPGASQMMRVLAQVAWALDATHGVEGLHRDVKGENVLVREGGHAMLVDFGVGHLKGARTLTHDLLPPGTLEYRSPEALRFLRDWRSHPRAHYVAGPADDVYALGVMAHRLVWGRYPPPSVVLDEKEAREQSPTLEAPHAQVEVPTKLAELIQQMLAMEPKARGNAAEVARALEKAAEEIDARRAQPAPPSFARLITEEVILIAAPRRNWTECGAMGLMLGLLVVALVEQWRSELPEERLRETGLREEESVGLADSARAKEKGLVAPVAERKRIGTAVPEKPLPGQRLAPCEKPEIEINDGCWVILGNEKPPCGRRSYEWKGGCYYPVAATPPPPTSTQP